MDQEKGRKPMSPQDQKKIQTNWGFLKENLRDHITLIRDALFAKMVLNTVDKAKIDKVIKTDDEDTAIDELLKILMRSDDGSFEKFVCCLKEYGFNHMVTKLCSEDDQDEDTVTTGEEREVRIVVIGKTGAGKSALGNSLLNLKGDDIFPSKFSACSVTQTNQLKQKVVHAEDGNYILKLLDTPGLSDTTKDNKETAKELVKCIEWLQPGPHVFAFVFKLDRICDDIIDNIQFLKDTFGSCLEKYGIIVLTGQDHLDTNETFETWLDSANDKFQQFLRVYCNGRYVSINNKEKDPQIKQPQVRHVINIILKTIKINNWHYYRNEMYEEAKSLHEYKLKKIEEENSRIERGLREELKAKMKEIDHLKTVENEHEEQYRNLEKQKEQAIRNLQQENQRLKKLENENKDTLKRMGELEIENDALKQQKQAFENLQQLNKQLITELNKIKMEDEEKLEKLCRLQRENDDLKRARNDVQQLELLNVSMGTVTIAQQGTTARLKGVAVNYYSHGESPEPTIQQTRHMVSGQTRDTGLANTESDLLSYNTEQTENQIGNTSPLTLPNMNRMTEDMSEFEANQELVDLSESLHTSCVYGTLDNVRELIGSGKDVNGRDRRNMTPLMYCARSAIDPVAKIQLLMSYTKSDMNQKDVHGNNILHHACRVGTLETVQYLIQNIVRDVNTKNRIGRTPLFDCCESKIDAIAKIELLVEEGANIAHKDNKNDQILHIACSGGILETVKYLIDALKIDVNTTGFKNRTPFMNCVSSKASPLDKMKFLVSKGAVTGAIDHTHCNNALHRASSFGTAEVVDYLKDIIDVNSKSYRDRTPIFYCCESMIEPVEKIKSIVSKGADLYAVDSQNVTVFEYACLAGLYKTVNYLIETNDETKMLTLSSMFYSCESRVKPVDKIKLLRSMNIDIRELDENNESILHRACQMGNPETVKYLLDIEIIPELDEDEIDLLISYCKESNFKPEEKVALLTTYCQKHKRA